MLPYKLTETSKIVDARTALLCARLYLRGGKRRLRAGYARAGIAALYDAVLFGMRYYITRHQDCDAWVENTDPWDASALFHALARAGVFEDPLTLHRFSLLVERALWQEALALDVDSTLADVEKMLSKLGVVASGESSLPGESSLTIL
jgi:hypothetical protein